MSEMTSQLSRTAATRAAEVAAWVDMRAAAVEHQRVDQVYRRRDRVFGFLFLGQWAFAIAIALLWSPHGWEGKVQTTHMHVWYALLFGAGLTLPALMLIRALPGTALTRHVIAASQMLWSALLIHLSGGRIETHFHVFGSLAFIAFYRDWKVIVTATVVVALEHLTRGILWAESVYGVANPEWWRFIEHASWVIFEDVVLVMGILEARGEMRILARQHAELEKVNETVERRVQERTVELASSREQYRLLLETTNTVPWEMESAGLKLAYIGPQVEKLLGMSPEECGSTSFSDHVHPDDRNEVIRKLSGLTDDGDTALEFRLRRTDGRWVWVRCIASVTDGGSIHRVLRGILLDVTEARQLEMDLRQAQKLESVGRLASGVAHEINTPVQFVSDSVHFVRDAVKDLSELVGKYRAMHRAVVAGEPAAETVAEVAKAEEIADVEYLLENVPKALDRSLEGLGRVAVIVRSMKEFAHPDQKEMTSVDLNQALQSTLTIARNEYKYVADVETDFEELPGVTCLGGDVNQVFLNLIVNAAHAIGDVVATSGGRGKIVVRTRVSGDAVVVSIGDTGGGIPEAIRARIFDPFFTTKEVGKGTGQGLAIARSVVVDRHQGEISYDTELGVGTTFHIRLPIGGAAETAAAA